MRTVEDEMHFYLFFVSITTPGMINFKSSRNPTLCLSTVVL